jgi:membrane protein implicated in regulation of membrane protease activity
MNVWEILSKVEVADHIQVGFLMLLSGVLCLWYGISMVVGKVAATVVLILFSIALFLFLSGGAVTFKSASNDPICISEEICPFPPKKPKFNF